MTAKEQLLEYGYQQAGDDFVPARASSERWRSVPGGFECYAMPTLTFGGGKPWGLPQDGGFVKVPYRQSERFANASGLHPATHPECFEWVWPEERLVEIYAHAPKDGKANPYLRQADGIFALAE